MAETIQSLQFLSHFSDHLNPNNNNNNNDIHLITDSYFMERGHNYNAYAQLRESKLISKRSQLYEIDQISDMPTSENSSPAKKLMKFHGSFEKVDEDERFFESEKSLPAKKLMKFQGSFEKIDEDEQFYEIPMSEFLPETGNSGVSGIPRLENSPAVKKSVKFQGSYGGSDQFYEIPKSEFSPEKENSGVSGIPRSENSPAAKKSVKFQGNCGGNDQFCDIPRSEFSPVGRKSVRFQGAPAKNGENFQISGIPRSELSPPVMKQARLPGVKKQGYSVLAQSVPDFSLAARKENRRPGPDYGNVSRIPRFEKSATPPPPRKERMYGGSGGSKSVNTGEKQSRVIVGRKSYASIEELKGLSIAANHAINGEIRGRKSNVLRKSTLFSTTKYY